MKNASPLERLTSTSGGNGLNSPNEFARKVKNLFTGNSPSMKKRSVSIDTALDSKPAASLMFGIPLSDICKREGGHVPFIVRRIVKHIEDEGLDQEGIYRVNGNAKVIERLKADFDRDGNADFEDVEIPAIGSLLKQFLRELPGGIVPEDFVSHFVKVQQRYPSEATPEALDTLKDSLRLLPTTNYNMLSYLIQHLTRVAKHSDKNKMTPVSLAIVFGPNIFPCGSGIEALKLQGYSNSTTCRMIQNYRTLFDRRRGQKRAPPEKPQPYTEHKRRKQEAVSVVPMETGAGSSTHDLECSHSERSIDEAIEKSSASGTLSPISPTPMMDEEAKPKSVPLRHAPPRVVEPYKEDKGKIKKLSLIGRSRSLEGSSSDETGNGVEQSFHRQYAKRGMKFKTRHSVSEGTLGRSRPSGGDQILRHPQLNALNSSREDLRTPSPYSWQSSPGTSPPTSPMLTPRSSKVVSSVIEDTVKNFLFQSSTSSATANGKQDQSTDGDKAPKADVYGLLLPVKKDQPKPSNGDDVQLRQTTGDKAVTMRQGKKMRNRKSAVYGSDINDAHGVPDDTATSPIHNMNVKFVSFSPENSFDGGNAAQVEVVETRQGKVSDLVKQFEDEEKEDELKKEMVGSQNVGENAVVDVSENSGGNVRKKKPANKVFDMFEKSGIIMGMGGPPSQTGKARAVSFASEVSTIPTLSSEGSPSPRSTLTTIRSTVGASEDLTAVSKDFLSVSTCDEDVFSSPSHSMGTNSAAASPSHGKGQRGQLGTTTSDDVFISPVHAASQQAEESTDGGGSELDTVKRSGTTLEHLTLSRPKGPAARKKPRRVSAPPSNHQGISSSSDTAATRNTGVSKQDTSVKVIVSSEQQHKEVDQQSKEENVTPAGTPLSRALLKEKPLKKDDRTRLKSAPEVSVSNEVSPKDMNEEKKMKKSVLAVGEDMPNGGERVKSSHGERRKNSLKESCSTTTRHRRKRHTVANIEQLRGEEGEESSKGVSAVMSRMPLVDLTSLAPENKQAVEQVKEGWKEGTQSSDVGTSLPTATTTIKDIAQKIHELKLKVRKFEDDFVAEHGRKPSSSEKMPVRTLLEELNRLRRLHKELKEKEKVSEDSVPVKTAAIETTAVGKSPPAAALPTVTPEEVEVPFRLRSQSVPAASKERGSVDRSRATTSVVSAMTGATIPNQSRQSSSSVEKGGRSPLQQSLEKIMTGLATRRKMAGRPDDPMLMSKEQATEEKQTIQKALLSFEKTYGRPQTKADKLLMKPLYDRYRQIKKICSGDFQKESRSSLSMMSPHESLPGLECTTDSLPSVTLLQSGMAKSLPAGHPGYSEPDEPLAKSAVELLGVTSTSELESNPTAVALSPTRRETQPAEKMMSEKQLLVASLEEVKQQNQLFLARKKELRTVLKDFESAFMGLHGRTVTRADRKPMQREYDEYKSIKTKLLTVDSLLKKAKHPQKTI